jgi:hypothetical protein
MSPAELNVVAGPGRFRGEARVVFTDGKGGTARGLWARARPGVRPWVDLHEADFELLEPIARALGPGAAIMVTYGLGETERALRRKVPAAATPLGLALLGAGCRWLKDYYFAEGGREGHAKLQGELPLDDAGRRRAERALNDELERFLAGGAGTEADRRRARRALSLLDAQPGADSRRLAPSAHAIVGRCPDLGAAFIEDFAVDDW